MNLEQIHYLAEINRCHSMRKASEKLHITAQALSQSISSLETELGLALTENSRRGSYLTKDGHIILEAGEEFLQVLKELQRKSLSTSYKYLPKADIPILSVDGMANTILPKIFSQLYLDYPNTNIDLDYTLSCQQILDTLSKSQEYEVAFMSFYDCANISLPDFQKYPNLEFHPLFISKYCCSIPEGHEIYHYNSVSIYTVLKYPIMIYKTGEDVLLPLLNAFAPPKKIISIPNFAVFNQLVQDSQYLTFNRLSSSFDSSMPLNKHKLLPLKENINISFGYVLRKDCSLTPLTKELLDYVENYCKNHYGAL